MENFNSDDEIHPGDFEPDSIESRAAARAKLSNNRLPYIIMEWVESEVRNPDGGQTGPLRESTYGILQVTGMAERHYVREEDETREQFLKRISDDVPAVSMGTIHLLPEPPTKEQTT
jgi:hypothetical protein